MDHHQRKELLLLLKALQTNCVHVDTFGGQARERWADPQATERHRFYLRQEQLLLKDLESLCRNIREQAAEHFTPATQPPTNGGAVAT